MKQVCDVRGCDSVWPFWTHNGMVFCNKHRIRYDESNPGYGPAPWVEFKVPDDTTKRETDGY